MTPFDDEGRKLLAKYDPDYRVIIYQGRIVAAKNDLGHAMQVTRLLGTNKKKTQWEVIHGDPTGLVQLDLPWVLGGYEYGGSINQIWHGWIGDVRIVGRPLRVDEFMIAQ